MYDRSELKRFLKSVMKVGIRSRQRRVQKFEKSSLKTIVLSLEGGILGVTGCLSGEKGRKIQTLIFNKSRNGFGVRVWTLRKAKMWLSQHRKGIRRIVDPERIINKVQITKMVKAMEKALIEKLPKAITKVLEG